MSGKGYDLWFNVLLVRPDGSTATRKMYQRELPITGSQFEGSIVGSKEWSFTDPGVDMVIHLEGQKA